MRDRGGNSADLPAVASQRRRRAAITPARIWLALTGLALVLGNGILPTPAQASPFISATITFVNNGQLPLRLNTWKLDHGCWTNDVTPPNTIGALSTVSFEAESCGVGTGSEGYVEYTPYGSPATIHGHHYWDVPASGTNTAQNAAPSGCTSSQSGPGDGNHVFITFTMGCSASSGDGIADVWKLHGAEFDPGNGGQFIDLPAMGATVGQKDIFVQIDWMKGTLFGEFNQQITPAVIKRWVDLYAANGYKLHVDEGPGSIMNFATNAAWGPLGKGQAVAYQAGLGTATDNGDGTIKYDWTAYNNLKASTFTPTGRASIFHHILAAHQLGALGNSGISRTPGVDTIISLGTFTNGVGSDDEQLATLMHEFGHGLGLDHGGQDAVNYKPNYFSVMNYAFQFSGITRNGVTTWDYSHNADSTLVESNPPGLNEASGIPSAAGVQTVHYCPAKPGVPAARVTVADAAGRVDWDCDGNPDANPVSADVNNDPGQAANTLGTLTSYEDWSRLKLAVGGIGSFGAGVPAPPITQIVDDPTPQMVQEIVPVDTQAPVSTAQATPGPNAAGWNNTDVSVSLSATDDRSGVARIEYNLDGTGYVDFTVPVLIQAEGTHTFLYRATDRAGNVETAQTLSVNIDKTKPATTGQTAPAANAAGWNNTDVTATLRATDDRSGVAKIEYDLDGTGYVQYAAPVVVSSEGNHTVAFRATDAAGNVETPNSVSFKIDKTKPIISYTGGQATYSILDTVNIACAATDPVSGGVASGVDPATNTCQNVVGPAYNLDPNNTYSASATDFAGNTGTGSVSFRVVVTYADLCTLTKRFVTNAGLKQAESMCAELDAAQAAQQRGNANAKANAIGAYVSQVDAGVRGGYLSAVDAAILKKWANLL